MRFLTKESFREPPTEEVMRLIPAEQARIKELAKQGVVEAFCSAADKSAAWVIWNCDSPADLEEKYNTLPLHDYLESEIALLADGD